MRHASPRSRRWWALGLAGSLCAATLVAVAQSPAVAASATFTVTTTADSGPGSLREAIAAAQVTDDDDTIVFDAGVFAPGTSHTITLVTALPTISKPLTINGPGQDVLTISGDDSVRVLTVDGPDNIAPGVRFDISDVTLTRGLATLLGGAVTLRDSQTTMTRLRITASQGREGGAIYSGSSGLTIEDSLVEGNTATYRGGGIRSDYKSPGGELMSVLRVINSTIRGNTAPDGGGIYAARPMELIDDTITGNTATTGKGGGVWVGFAYDDSIVRTVISGNTAVSGGGIDVGTPGRKGRLTISDSTISDNVATSGDGSGGINVGNMMLGLRDSTLSNGAQGDCVRTWWPNGIWLTYTVAVEAVRSTMGESNCAQLDRGTLVYSYPATTAGATGVAVSAGDPPFLVDDTITLCTAANCSTTARAIARVTDVSLVDDTFAFIPTTSVAAYPLTGEMASAWVALPKIASLSPDTGREGDLVTLTGAGFGDPAAGPTVSVTVGGAAASGVTHVDDSTITFMAPAGATGAATVAVGSNANTAAVTWGSRASAFTYLAPTPPPDPPSILYPPSAPQAVSAEAGDGAAVVSWSAPASSGSFAVSSYQVRASPGGRGCMTASTSCEVTGLANGTAYTFTVRALSGAGWGPWSASSAPVTPEAPVVASITITGSRAEVRGKPRVIVRGTVEGLDPGTVLRPWMRIGSRTTFTEGRARVVVEDDGGFTWSRRSGRTVTVYVATQDGSVTSNRVTIR